MSRILGTVAVAALVLTVRPWTPARAMQPEPLPVFDLTALDGTSTTSAQLTMSDRWLLLYVEPSCRPCDGLLRLVKKEEFPKVPPAMTIIVGGVAIEAVRALRDRYPDLAEASWYSDQSKHACAQLSIKGAPVLLGLRQGVIAWRFTGVLPDATHMKSVLQSWLEP